jgi:hypothetical protein
MSPVLEQQWPGHHELRNHHGDDFLVNRACCTRRLLKGMRLSFGSGDKVQGTHT